MKLEDQIAVMQAFKEGKEIEMRSASAANGEWGPSMPPRWNWRDLEYRVKPEPLVVTLGPTTFAERQEDGWVVIDREDNGRVVLTDQELDTLHAASLTARGIEGVPYQEPDGEAVYKELYHGLDSVTPSPLYLLTARAWKASYDAHFGKEGQ